MSQAALVDTPQKQSMVGVNKTLTSYCDSAQCPPNASMSNRMIQHKKKYCQDAEAMKIPSPVAGRRIAIFRRRVIQFLPLPTQKLAMLSNDQANVKCDQAVLYTLVGDKIHPRRPQFARDQWVRQWVSEPFSSFFSRPRKAFQHFDCHLSRCPHQWNHRGSNRSNSATGSSPVRVAAGPVTLYESPIAFAMIARAGKFCARFLCISTDKDEVRIDEVEEWFFLSSEMLSLSEKEGWGCVQLLRSGNVYAD
ncbi:hypothetical protein EDD22DRAFT_1047474 [Suillus occidentalis]|nr:hypothetical protein EDD22DRAFT_1047474 [Suillus occidentalis]